jgi:hypothetical protein
MECLKGADRVADLSSVSGRLGSTGARMPAFVADSRGDEREDEFARHA